MANSRKYAKKAQLNEDKVLQKLDDAVDAVKNENQEAIAQALFQEATESKQQFAAHPRSLKKIVKADVEHVKVPVVQEKVAASKLCVENAHAIAQKATFYTCKRK